MVFHKFKQDYYIFTNEEWRLIKGVLRMIRHRHLRFCFVGRLSASNNKFFSIIGEFFRKYYERHYGLEIYFKKIRGGGYYYYIHIILQYLHELLWAKM